jgi:AcrR family transcriptional regulator
MTQAAAGGRQQQKLRTRKDLLAAAARLMKQGQKPTLEEVAEAAMVSRATAYRYFPDIDALLQEATLDIAAPLAADILGADAPAGAAARVERVDSALHDMVLSNEAALRVMLARSLERRLASGSDPDVPARQNRRTPLIEAALEPHRREFKPAALKTLVQALALVVGTEAMIVCQDVLQIDDQQARKVKRWAIRALVDAARKDA